jgi:hypothetical protein
LFTNDTKGVLNTRVVNFGMTIVDDELGQRVIRGDDDWVSRACRKLGMFQPSIHFE